VAGVARALAVRRPGHSTLRYHVPPGQDPAAALAAIRQNGLRATIDMNSGYEDIVISCDPSVERERVRSVLRDAPLSMGGSRIQGPPIAFADEQVP
jgi:hypothetical protein